MTLYEDALGPVITDVVAPNAAAVDQEGRFPRASLDALAGAGILGLISSADVGGGGAGLRDAATVIEQLAGACGSTAMVVLMHYAATTVLEAHGMVVLHPKCGGLLSMRNAGARQHIHSRKCQSGHLGAQCFEATGQRRLRLGERRRGIEYQAAAPSPLPSPTCSSGDCADGHVVGNNGATGTSSVR